MKTTFLFSLFALVCVGVEVRGEDDALENGYLYFRTHTSGYLFWSKDAAKLQQIVETMRKKPLLYKVLAGPTFVNALTGDHPTPLDGFEWQEGKHDFNRYPGRAAWAMEELLGIKLPTVTPKTTKKELAEIQKEAERLLREHTKKIMKESGEGKVGRPTAEIKKLYHGKIVQSQDHEKSIAAGRVMAVMLDEWFPLGKKLSDLEEIVGYKGKSWKMKEVEMRVAYHFGRDWPVFSFFFDVEKGVIVGLLIQKATGY